MIVLDPTFKATLALDSTVIAWCWRIERVDGLAYGFTSFDLMLPINSTPYLPFTGFTPTADSNSEGLQSNNSQELAGLLTDGLVERVSAEELLAGKWDGAKVICFQVDVTDLPNTLADNPPKHLVKYERYIKTAILTDLGFRFQLRDDDWQLETEIGKLTKKFCGNDLGNGRCGVDLNLYTFTETIETVAGRTQFTSSGSYTPNQFTRGKITFLTGKNAGVAYDIKTFEVGNLFTLWQPLFFLPEIGDEIEIVQGCGKTLYECITRYQNAEDFDGEPHIPTTDQAINTPVA